jgi:hypothetical protein
VSFSCIPAAQERVSVQPGRERASAAYAYSAHSFVHTLYRILGVHRELARAYGLAMQEYADNTT